MQRHIRNKPNEMERNPFGCPINLHAPHTHTHAATSTCHFPFSTSTSTSTSSCHSNRCASCCCYLWFQNCHKQTNCFLLFIIIVHTYVNHATRFAFRVPRFAVALPPLDCGWVCVCVSVCLCLCLYCHVCLCAAPVTHFPTLLLQALPPGPLYLPAGATSCFRRQIQGIYFYIKWGL